MDTQKKRYTFDTFYQELLKYKEEHGDLLVPINCVTQDGYKLGQQVSSIRSGNIKVSDEEKAKLSEIGFVWKVKEKHYNFDIFYQELLKYKEKHKDVLVSIRYVTSDGYKLGKQVNNIRSGNIKVSDEEKAKLNEIGFVWKVKEKHYNFDIFYQGLLKYKEKHGDVLVPQKYVANGCGLGKQVNGIRSGNIKISNEEKVKLNEIGFVWKIKENQYTFDKLYQGLLKYKEEHGDLLVPIKYVTPDEYKLGKQVSHIRGGVIKVSDEEMAKLNEIGFVWNALENQYKYKLSKFDFDLFFENFLKYQTVNQNKVIPYDAEVDNYDIGFYARNIRTNHIQLDESQIQKLKEVGFVFDTHELFKEEINDENLLQRMLKGDMQARVKVIERFYKIVPYCAKLLQGAYKYKEIYNREDLMSLGEEELVNAVDRYSPKETKGICLHSCKNYLIPYVRGKMQSSLSEKLRLKETSIDAPLSDDSTSSVKDLIQDKNADTEKTVIDLSAGRQLLKTLKQNLSQGEYIVVCLRFGLTKSHRELTIAEIAEKYGTTEEVVERTLTKALKKLKQNMKEDEWED